MIFGLKPLQRYSFFGYTQVFLQKNAPEVFFYIFQQIHYFHLIVGKGLFGKLSELIGVYRFQYDLFRFEIKQELHVRRQRE